MNGPGPIRYLSLAAKAGKLITGGDEVEKSIRRGRGGLLILASDAAGNAVKRGEAMAGAPGVSLKTIPYTKSQIAAAVGRGSSVALALVTDEGLAAAFLAAAAKALEQEEQI